MSTTQRPSAAVCSSVIGYFEDEREKMLAIAIALEELLKPKPDDDSPRFTEWRLSQVLADILSDASITSEARSRLDCREMQS